MAVMQDEIFGPLLPLVPYGTLDEAIAYVNARPRPLALYVFDDDRRNVERGARTHGVRRRDRQRHHPAHRAGRPALRRRRPQRHGPLPRPRRASTPSRKKKAVFRQSRLNGLGLFMPPYTKRFESLIRLLIRK